MDTIEKLKTFKWINRTQLEEACGIPHHSLQIGEKSKRVISKTYLDKIEAEFRRFIESCDTVETKKDILYDEYKIVPIDVSNKTVKPVAQLSELFGEPVKTKIYFNNINGIANTIETFDNNTTVHLSINGQEYECYTKGKAMFEKETNEQVNYIRGMSGYVFK